MKPSDHTSWLFDRWFQCTSGGVIFAKVFIIMVDNAVFGLHFACCLHPSVTPKKSKKKEQNKYIPIVSSVTSEESSFITTRLGLSSSIILK